MAKQPRRIGQTSISNIVQLAEISGIEISKEVTTLTHILLEKQSEINPEK